MTNGKLFSFRLVDFNFYLRRVIAQEYTARAAANDALNSVRKGSIHASELRER